MPQELRDRFACLAAKPHGRVSPCFMTGKQCMHTYSVDEELARRRKAGSICGFGALPYRPYVQSFFDLCLAPFLEQHCAPADGQLRMARADQVSSMGYIMCEKVCRAIQQSDFVVVDVSLPNANVFYEFGLAYGLQQKLLVVAHDESIFGRRMVEALARVGCTVFLYHGLSMLDPKSHEAPHELWQPPAQRTLASTGRPRSVLILRSALQPADAQTGEVDLSRGPQPPEDISISFEGYFEAALHRALSRVHSAVSGNPYIPREHVPIVEGLMEPLVPGELDDIESMLGLLRQAYLVFIRTGGGETRPMAYFWLGYCHACGKRVIPVTVVGRSEDRVDDLAFDIRALWHMTFVESEPRQIEPYLEQVLRQVVEADLAAWCRGRFWESILGDRGKVSLFTGALHNAVLTREMIGDWDLRTVSEMMAFFHKNQYRPEIEPPVYQPERAGTEELAPYIRALRAMLEDRNCIVIGSADVNPLTEIVLAQLYGVGDGELFGGAAQHVLPVNAVVLEKWERMSAGESHVTAVPGRTFSRVRYIPPSETPRRGFLTAEGPSGGFSSPLVTQDESPTLFTVYAHLVVAKNPFCSGGPPKYVIVLNGASGPGTYALAHALTGGTARAFTASGDDFNPAIESERVLGRVLCDINRIDDRPAQYMLEVSVGSERQRCDPAARSEAKCDWRRVVSWRLVDL